MHAGEVAATKPPVEIEDGARIMAKSSRDVAGTVINLPSTVGRNCPLRLTHESEDAKEHAHAVQESTWHAWFTHVQEDNSELEDFKLVFG